MTNCYFHLQTSVFRTLSAIYIGALFGENKLQHQFLNYFSEYAPHQYPFIYSVASLLCIDQSDLNEALTTNSSVTRGEMYILLVRLRNKKKIVWAWIFSSFILV